MYHLLYAQVLSTLIMYLFVLKRVKKVNGKDFFAMPLLVSSLSIKAIKKVNS